MSDGPSDCARIAGSRAEKFVKKRYPETQRTRTSQIPAEGRFVFVYEEWLDHIVEIIEDRKVLKRFKIPVFGRIRELKINDTNYSVGALQ